MKEKIHEICPVSETIKIIGGKWRLLIIHEVGNEKIRFGALKRRIPAISEKMLIQELKFLVELEVLDRKAYKEIPPRVEYSITEFGREIFPIIEQMKTFGEKRIAKILLKNKA